MPSKHPPHLPPKSCSVPMYRRFQSLKWFLFFILVSFLTGITAALVAVAWVAPLYMMQTPLYTIQVDSERQASRTIDELFERRVERQLVTVYDSEKKVGGDVYTRDAIFGTGVFFTSDGWFALYGPDYRVGDERAWEIVDHKGDTFDIEHVLVGFGEEMLYVKIAGSGFTVSDFPSWDGVESGQFAWAFIRGEWYTTVYGDGEWVSDTPTYAIDSPQYRPVLSGQLEQGSVLLDRQGLPLGFVDVDGHVLSFELTEKQYPVILENQQVSRESFGLVGHAVDYVLVDGVWTERLGFYIADLTQVRAKDGFVRGDIVIAIEGQSVEERVLWRQVDRTENFTVTVLRDGAEHDILVTIL